MILTSDKPPAFTSMTSHKINWLGVHRQHREDLFTVTQYREVLICNEDGYVTTWSLRLGAPIAVNCTAEEVAQITGDDV